MLLESLYQLLRIKGNVIDEGDPQIRRAHGLSQVSTGFEGYFALVINILLYFSS
jgi:hypothetical protein